MNLQILKEFLFILFTAVLIAGYDSITAIAQTVVAPAKSPFKLFETPATKNDYTPEMLQRFFGTEVTGYQIENVSKSKELKLVGEPLLNWSNPERKFEQGSFFIWLDGKHPAVVGSIFTYQHNNKVFRRHELISLSGEPLVARLDGQEVWKPKPASIEGTLVAEDLIPATTAPRRLTQMRTIARELAGRHISADGKVSELRLLPQPLFRYDAPEAGIIDGAIFTLSVATDPEILVVLEARSIDSVSNWYIVPFRSHFDALELSYKGKQIWSASTNLNLKMTKALQLPFALEPYFIFTPRIPLPPAEQLK